MALPLPSWNKVSVKPNVSMGCDNVLNSVRASPVSDNHLCPVANSNVTTTIRRPANPIGAPANVVRRHARPEREPKCGLMVSGERYNKGPR